ncbi:MAG TPA: type IV pilus modification protein PilV [Noviherbaspirillum sp.]
MPGLKKKGFSLIEVLVSLLVLAIGVIGAAGMQLAAARTAQQSAFQTFALQLAAEMADAMRAGGGQLESMWAMDYSSANDGEPVTPARFCYADSCNAQEFAEFQLYEWKKRVKTGLPAGRVLVCRDATPWDSVRRSLSWSCEGGAGEEAPLVVKLGWQAKNPDGSLVKDAGNSFPPNVVLTVAL